MRIRNWPVSRKLDPIPEDESRCHSRWSVYGKIPYPVREQIQIVVLLAGHGEIGSALLHFRQVYRHPMSIAVYVRFLRA